MSGEEEGGGEGRGGEGRGEERRREEKRREEKRREERRGEKGRKQEERKGEERRGGIDCMLAVISIVGIKLSTVGAHLCLQLSGSGELRLKMLLLPLQSKQPLTSTLQLLQRGEEKKSMKQYTDTGGLSHL